MPNGFLHPTLLPMYLMGGTNASQNPVTYTVESQEITISDPTKPGYTFKGWNAERGENRYSPTIPSGSTGDRKFEACWQANRNTVVFHGNNATKGRCHPFRLIPIK